MEKQQGEENCECNVVGCILRRTRGWSLAVDFPFLRWTSRNWVVNTTKTWKWRSSKRTVTEASQQVKGYEFHDKGAEMPSEESTGGETAWSWDKSRDRELLRKN